MLYEQAGGEKKPIGILFRNCQKYLPGELEILCPDIIVTQGAEAKKAVGSFYEILETIDEYASTIEMGGREVFWLHTYGIPPTGAVSTGSVTLIRPETALWGGINILV